MQGTIVQCEREQRQEGGGFSRATRGLRRAERGLDVHLLVWTANERDVSRASNQVVAVMSGRFNATDGRAGFRTLSGVGEVGIGYCRIVSSIAHWSW